MYLAPYQIQRLKSFFILMVILLLIFTLVVEHYLGSLFLNLAKIRINQLLTEKFTYIVLQEVAKADFQYEKLIHIEKDEKGKITLVQANTIIFNKFAATVGNKLQKEINSLAAQRVEIPLGQMFGIRVLAAVGPKIKIRFIPMGFVEVKCSDSFQSGGLNQTRHQLYITLNASYKVAIPLVSAPEKLSYKLPVIETVIVGEVPQIMLPSLQK
ncbi:sporulation protein YunB [Carboxydothermus pertinax]|uniref:Sporulation protein YunB n=1 Tax=Carboxydothermus pertinax TaxID=870242 RepID=A0A1L8CUU7_9THEO|nr:sporulation protein YunB [Carboxydothermus pertinax]GAV22634.1 conserved hypothetical protein [Carboxydothermus pertinax]